MTVRHQGGGHNVNIIIDPKRTKDNIPAKVASMIPTVLPVSLYLTTLMVKNASILAPNGLSW